MPSPELLARRVAIVSILIGAILAIVKITLGLAAGSVALVSDGFESATDFFTSGLVLTGLWIAAKPPDKDHPYGHGRFEILVGLAIGAVLVVTGAAISIRAIEERHVQHRPEFFAVWPLLGSIVVKSALGAWKFRAGRRSGSADWPRTRGTTLWTSSRGSSRWWRCCWRFLVRRSSRRRITMAGF